MTMQTQWHAMRGFSRDPSVTKQKLKPGTVRRISGYARPYRVDLVIFLLAAALDAVVTVTYPLLLAVAIHQGLLHKPTSVVIGVAAAVAGLAVFDALLGVLQRYFTSRVGEGLIYDLRSQVFGHVQQQPIAFFTRAQTGSLVSRVDNDVIGAQQALTSTLSSVVSSVLQVILVLAAMFTISWQVTVVALVLIPIFLYPARRVGRHLQRLTRESMQLDAQMGSTMTERFNVAGAMLSKLYGRPADELGLFSGRAGRVRDIGVLTALWGSALVTGLGLLATMSTSLVYGLGGWLVIQGSIQIGGMVALATLLTRLYGPITALSNVQVNVMTALVSFDRVFEVIDLKPLIDEKPDAIALTPPQRDGQAPRPGSAPDVTFDQVSFRYPSAAEVSLASLESIALPAPEKTGPNPLALTDVSFTAPAGRLTALVGPSGAGKTTITQLVSRLYDPVAGTVRIAGTDIRDVTLESLRDVVGVVTQDAHLYHDTIRANLLYARPEATEHELVLACQAAQIWELISGLADGLDTVVGDRGYRLSGGEKQRLAIARLLLKAPEGVVLDEATAHLDSESAAAVQRALSLVPGHRPPAVHRAGGRPDPGPRPRSHRRAGSPRRTAGRPRSVRRAVPH